VHAIALSDPAAFFLLHENLNMPPPDDDELLALLQKLPTKTNTAGTLVRQIVSRQRGLPMGPVATLHAAENVAQELLFPQTRRWERRKAELELADAETKETYLSIVDQLVTMFYKAVGRQVPDRNDFIFAR
jgi:hypothetical protein